MYTTATLAAQASLKAALLQVLATAQTDGQYLTTVRASLTIEDGDALGEYEIGGIAREQFHAFTGGSL